MEGKENKFTSPKEFSKGWFKEGLLDLLAMLVRIIFIIGLVKLFMWLYNLFR